MFFKTTKIALVQDTPGIGLRDSFKRLITEFKPDILAFSEYFLVGPEYSNTATSIEKRDVNFNKIKAWSTELSCLVVGGTIVENECGFQFNRCYLIDKGVVIGHYDKIHLYRNEGGGLIIPGSENQIFIWREIRIGLLICADVLYPESFEALQKPEPDLVFIPTTSPYKANEKIEDKFARDNEIFAKGAAVANSILLKISATGSIIGHRLQGRSLVACPGKILWRVDPQDEDRPALVLINLIGDKNNPSLDMVVHRD